MEVVEVVEVVVDVELEVVVEEIVRVPGGGDAAKNMSGPLPMPFEPLRPLRLCGSSPRRTRS
ncbi:MAG: hypothetical protein IPF99_37635, partial [Deltaproteobacteria bacterium]|nr:hypothetical protein [Deltaproteobacteria bacterium]